MRKLLYLPLLLLVAVNVRAQVNAANCTSAAVQTAINSATSGQTVNVPACAATAWGTTAVVISGKSIVLKGATTCTGSGDPNVGGGVISCTDATNITLGNDSLDISSTATNFVTVTGFTFSENVSVSLGNIKFKGALDQISFRFFGNHVQMPINTVVITTDNYGLVDLNYFQDTSAGAGPTPINFIGDFQTKGYTNWNDATLLGSNQSVYMERNYYTATSANAEGFFDAYAGCKVVVRFNTVIGNQIGGWHGTDSGPYRGCVSGEVYGNSITNNTGPSEALMNTRSGTLLFWGNKASGSIPYGQVALQYFRTNGSQVGISSWGQAHAGLNWIPLSTTPSDPNSNQMTLNAADWQATHTYAANAAIGPTSNNTGKFNFQNQGASCTTSGTRPAFNQTILGTTPIDGTCTWKNVGGTTTASTIGTSGYCALNPDTTANADSICNALSPGDTASRFFDTNSGVYPFRDQPGRGHNQALFPNYQWLNTGAALPAPPIMTVNPLDSNTENQDTYNYTASFTGGLGCSTAPHCGVGSGTLAAIPATCTTGVGYWATNQGSWNVSGNGSGNGVLYQCGPTNTWTVYYTPFTYPHPLAGGTSPVSTPTFSPAAGSYLSTQLVTITSATVGATICYTIDGTTPTANGSGTCTHGTTLANGGTITVLFTQLVQAVGSQLGFTDSAVGSATYSLPTAGSGTMVAWAN